MELRFSYFKATRSISQYLGWEIEGTDEEGGSVIFRVRYMKNRPSPDLTYFEARNVISELVGNMLVLKDEEFVPESFRRDWKEGDPDKPRNLAKTVTVP